MEEKLSEIEYSCQFFGFTPETFFQDFSEMVLEEMSLVIQHSLKELSSPTCEIENKKELMQNAVKIHHTWSQRAEVVLQKLKPTIKEFFTIPKNVLLPVDSEKVNQYSEEDVKKLEEEVAELEEKYASEVKAIQMYKMEIVMLEKLEPIEKSVGEAMNRLEQFDTFLNEFKEVNKLAQAHTELKKMVFAPEDDEDSSPDDAWKFKANTNVKVHEETFKTA